MLDLLQPFWPDDAGKLAAAESDVCLFAERLKAHEFDFAQFKQDFPFVLLPGACQVPIL